MTTKVANQPPSLGLGRQGGAPQPQPLSGHAIVLRDFSLVSAHAPSTRVGPPPDIGVDESGCVDDESRTRDLSMRWP
ncbi:hypothetical protein V9T40_007434 [Parthenolecanium corni]|uniref:Uncharacterized protein n=1 Tax=Parthenolecanium corni TaxID=536013 RepID=A0AAN9TWA6_9HEMI